MPLHRRKERILVAGLAVAIFALAYGSPLDYADSDPALALVAAQALIENGSLRLDPLAGAPGLAYELRDDYRVRRYAGAYYPNAMGVPVLSAPAVWLARRAGFDMLDQSAEFALQNLLSAGACALLFVLLFRLCRLYLVSRHSDSSHISAALNDAGSVGTPRNAARMPSSSRLASLADDSPIYATNHCDGRLETPASLTIAAISTLGTSAMSTGATGLWNSDYSLIFSSAALYQLCVMQRRGTTLPRLGLIGVLVGLGFFCRPSTALLGIAVLFHLLGQDDRRISRAAAALLAAIAVVIAAATMFPTSLPVPWMAAHYSPVRLRPLNPIGSTLVALIFSPSRGLLVFSPFLALVGAGSLFYLSALRRDRMFRLCATWIVLQLVVVAASAGKWWGGHSFGPRMLIDTVPAFALLTCMVWLQVRGNTLRPTRRVLAATYLVLGGVAVLIHSGQGLFNPATRHWNVAPNVDDHPELVWDWRHPQFLAHQSMLEARSEKFEARLIAERRASLPTYQWGAPIRPEATDVIFARWYPPGDGWRWMRGARGSLILRLAELDRGSFHVLHLQLGTLGAQEIRVRVNGAEVTAFEHVGFDPSWYVAALPAEVLRPAAENVIELSAGAPVSTPADPRPLALAFRQARLEAVPAASSTVTFADGPFFVAGFSGQEEGWRWSERSQAALLVPLGAVTPTVDYAVTLTAWTLGRQRIGLRINGAAIGEAVLDARQAASVTVPFPGSVLAPQSFNRIELSLPDAGATPADPRRLGLALVAVTIAPWNVTPSR